MKEVGFERKNILQNLKQKILNKKEKNFERKISIFDYYVYGDLHENYSEKLAAWLPPIKTLNVNIKSDTDVAGIINKAQGLYINALLPKKQYSINVISKDQDPTKDTNVKNQLAEITDELRKFIVEPEVNFMNAFYLSLADFLNYGNALVRIKESENNTHCTFQYIPFKNVWFYSEYMSETPIVMYKVDYIPETLPSFLKKMFGTEGINNFYDKERIEVYHLFVTGDGTNIIEYLYYPENDDWTEFKTYSKQTFPVFFARAIKQDQVYGLGVGILSLSNIYSANYYNNLIRNQAGKTVQIPVAMLNTLQLNDDYGDPNYNIVDCTPGGMTILNGDMNTNLSNGFMLLQNAPQEFELLTAQHKLTHLKIEQAYNIDIFNLASEPSTKTATEIMERKHVAQSIIDGNSSTYSNEKLYPELNFVLKKYVVPKYKKKLEKEGAEYLLSELDIFIESYATKQQKDIELLEMQQKLQIMQGLPQEVVSEMMDSGFFSQIKREMNK